MMQANEPKLAADQPNQGAVPFARRHGPALASLRVATLACLWLKIPPTWAPEAYGTHYADYAADLGNMDPKLAYTWFGPWFAHQLGVRSHLGWLLFLYAAFFVGIAALYTALHRRTDAPWLAAVGALVPVASTSGWFGTYLSGYPEWFLLGVLSLLLLTDSLVAWAILGSVAVWTHERSGFVLAVLPLLQCFVTPVPKRRVVLQYAVLLGVVLTFVLARGAFVRIDNPPFTFAFFWKEFRQGSEFARIPLTMGHVVEVWWEAYKAYLLVVAACLAWLLRLLIRSDGLEREQRRSLVRFLVTFVGSCGMVTAQLLMAVDSTRLIDFLVFPFLILFVVTHRHLGPHQRWLVRALAAAALANELLPVEFIGQHTRFPGR